MFKDGTGQIMQSLADSCEITAKVGNFWELRYLRVKNNMCASAK